MIDLIKADLYKESKDKKFFIYIALIVFVSVLALIFVNKNINLEKNDYNLIPKFNSEEYYDVNKYGDYQQYLTKYEEYKEVINRENIKNDLTYNTKARELLNYSLNFYFVFGLIVIFISYHALSYDYQKDTIKYIFLNKEGRISLIISKVVSMFLINLCFMLIMIFSMLITSMLLTGENIFLLKEYVFFNGAFREIPFVLNYLWISLINFVPLIFIIVFSIFLCILFKGSSIGIYIFSFLYFVSLTVSEFLFSNGFYFIKYTFLPYLDFTYLNDKVSVLYNNMIYNLDYSYMTSSIILLIFTFVFLALSFRLVKRDV